MLNFQLPFFSRYYAGLSPGSGGTFWTKLADIRSGNVISLKILPVAQYDSSRGHPDLDVRWTVAKANAIIGFQLRQFRTRRDREEQISARSNMTTRHRLAPCVIRSQLGSRCRLSSSHR